MVPVLAALFFLAQAGPTPLSPFYDEGVLQGPVYGLNCVGAGVTCTYSSGLGILTIPGGAGGLSDGDYGDVVVSGSGTAMAVEDDSHAHTGATISGLDAADTTSGTFADARVDGSLEADELVLAGDVDGTANANDLDEVAVESELEGVLDLQDLQGAVTPAKGGTGDDTSGVTGVPRVNAGDWTYAAGVSHLAASSSADLRGVLNDEVGTGAAMFGLTTTMADDLSCAGDQVVKRNAGDTAFECGTVAGGSGLTHPQVMSRASLSF